MFLRKEQAYFKALENLSHNPFKVLVAFVGDSTIPILCPRQVSFSHFEVQGVYNPSSLIYRIMSEVNNMSTSEGMMDTLGSKEYSDKKRDPISNRAWWAEEVPLGKLMDGVAKGNLFAYAGVADAAKKGRFFPWDERDPMGLKTAEFVMQEAKKIEIENAAREIEEAAREIEEMFGACDSTLPANGSLSNKEKEIEKAAREIGEATREIEEMFGAYDSTPSISNCSSTYFSGANSGSNLEQKVSKVEENAQAQTGMCLNPKF
ncbi:MAG: hypothetical protein K0R48_1154 [Gammaproteobacteria bacterium]|jgi:hypothetical protein|nr:hypothetical protein [Gammaproteobacteria bacterium]